LLVSTRNCTNPRGCFLRKQPVVLWRYPPLPESTIPTLAQGHHPVNRCDRAWIGRELTQAINPVIRETYPNLLDLSTLVLLSDLFESFSRQPPTPLRLHSAYAPSPHRPRSAPASLRSAPNPRRFVLLHTESAPLRTAPHRIRPASYCSALVGQVPKQQDRIDLQVLNCIGISVVQQSIEL
jgi:hypothetical protein